MRAKITFEGVTEFFQDTTDVVRVALGKTFGLEVVDSQPGLVLATTEDAVLAVSDNGTGPTGAKYTVVASSRGKSKVMLLNSNLTSAFFLEIDVYDEVANSLNPVAGAPELK